MSVNKSDEKNDCWRTSSNNTNRKKSTGICPKTFHANTCINTNVDNDNVIDKLKEAALNRVQIQTNQEYTNQVKLKRSAYRSVTNVQIFARQEQALQALDQMLDVHLNEIGRQCHDSHLPAISLRNITNDDNNAEAGQSLYCSSSSGDLAGYDDSKRTKPSTKPISYNHGRVSPRKASERAKLVEEFLSDRNKDLPLDSNNNASSFLPPLWCMEPRILSVETSKTGRRRYVVGNFGRLADYYWRKLDASARHYYELIREGTPCRLYFDIEYCKETNPDIALQTDEDIIEDLIEELSIELTMKYGLHIARKDVVDLESSTAKKFSRHLIVHLPNNALFVDTSHTGSFVKAFVGRLADELSIGKLQETRPILARYLFVKSKPAKNSKEKQLTTCIIDLGVYTRNRLFRILGSSKFGKPASAALHLSPTNKYPFPELFGNDKFYVPAQQNRQMSSDICNLEYEARNMVRHPYLDMYSYRIQPEILMYFFFQVPSLDHVKTVTDWHDHADALAKTLVVPLNSSKIKFPLLNNPDCGENEDLTVDLRPPKERNTKGVAQRIMKLGPSLYPCLDEFVQKTLAVRGGEEGFIRAWSITTHTRISDDSTINSETYDVITYQMSRNRWCERIQRAHKSNNIMWNVDLSSFQYWQTCHDPDCRAMHFRGKIDDLPQLVKVELDDILFEQAMLQLPTEKVEPQDILAKTSRERHNEVQKADDSFENALIKLVDDIEHSRLISNTQEVSDESDKNVNLENVKAIDATNKCTDDSWDEAFVTAIEHNPDLFP